MSMKEKSSSRIYDARGNGEGDVSCTITGNHQSFISDYTAIVVDKMNFRTMCIGNGQVDNAVRPNEEVCKTLNCMDDPMKILCIENHPADSRVKISKDNIVQTLSSAMGTGGGNTPMILESNEAVCVGNGQLQQARPQEKAGALNCMHDQQAIMENNSVVRRLTPLECERLQGFPDGWTDIGEWIDSKGKKHKEADSPRYKALGNSIALPFWEWMAKRITDQLVKDGVYHPTMASLFDGIGGFPLAFTRCGVKPVWASEIEEFPIAVTKKRFPETGDDT